MPNSLNSKIKPLHRSSRWREYQSKLKKKEAHRKSYRRLPAYGVVLCMLILAVYGIFTVLDKMLFIPNKTYSLVFPDNKGDFNKGTLQKIIRMLPFTTDTQNNFELSTDDKTYHIKSSINTTLQKFVIDQIDRKNSKFFGFVAMEAETGRILSMVSYDKNNLKHDICTDSAYPAASIFKIITSAAAIEKCGFDYNTPVSFNGNKYTLYKGQLKERSNRHSNRMSFADAFAESVNPVFGKIGIHHLGKTALESYAAAFGFNQNFDYEIPLESSSLTIDEDTYSWAEIACGFNKKTLISPLHGAVIISIILNNGKLVEPTLIDTITRENHIAYKRKPGARTPVINPRTAETLKKMMNATVASGTASKSFSGFTRDKILSRLNIGGKTGSINNNKHHLKYDWFQGFAEEKNGSKKIVISVLVVHEKFIGIRAARYSRLAIKEYFKNYYANTEMNHHDKKPVSL